MREFEHNGVVLEYEDIGSGEPVVFLHGMGGASARSKNLRASGRRPVCHPEPAGPRNSGADWEDYSFDRLCR